MQTNTSRRGRSGSSVTKRRPFEHTKRQHKRPARSSGGGFMRRDNRVAYGRGKRKTPTFNPTQFINTNPREDVVPVYEAKHTFSTFGLNHRLVQTVATMGLEHPSPIQDQIIPHILEGRDVIGVAETGTGKTAAFLIPLIDRTLSTHNSQTLILTPTRELAIQIEDELTRLARGQKLYSVICVGGTGIQPQIRALRRKNHFVIGTPGRIMDLMRRKSFTPQEVTSVVLDEADRMLDMGFIHDMRTILRTIPRERETLLFSATMSSATERVVSEFLKDPILVSVKKKDVTNSIKQDVVRYFEATKFETLTSLLASPDMERVIIFGAMKYKVEALARLLTKHGVPAESIHGNKSHGQRQRSLRAFKTGHTRVLVATDVAARGIHVDNVSHVINYDLPGTFEDYVHRIGRTGRADKRGMALTFVPA